MEIPEILRELEVLLDDCGIDECWSDWFREVEDRTAHLSGEAERIALLREIQHEVSEETLSPLYRYLPAHGQHGENPPRKLSNLIVALSTSVSNELGE